MKSRTVLPATGWSCEHLNRMNRRLLSSRWAAVLTGVLVFICILGGCRKPKVTEPTLGMDIAERFWIRILLFDNIRDCSLAGEGGFSAVDAVTGTKGDFRRLYRPIRVGIANAKIVIGEHIFGKEVMIEPGEPFVFELDGSRYRGNLLLVVGDDEKSFDAINIVPVDAYLAGVVGAEMPSYWEAEALKAQVIAARTYCLYIKSRVRGNRKWDVKKTQSHQVYGGMAAESARVWEVVRETGGKILIWQQGDDGEERIFPAYYASSCGGHTENSKNVFGDSYGPLVGVECPHCKSVAKKGFFFWEGVEFEADEVSRRIIERFAKLESLEKIVEVEAFKVTDYGKFGRIVSVKLVGENGKTGFLRGEDFRLTVDPSGQRIKSAACKISKDKGKFRFDEGRGFGHGVGMCQCGAQAMARKGSSVQEILVYYYPGSKTVRLY